MQTRYQATIKFLSFHQLTDPNEATRYFLMYIHNLLRQYMAARNFLANLFMKEPISGLDAMLCKKIITEYKQEKKGKESIQGLIACLKKSNELLEEDGVVAGMLSVLFSYFPEYLPNELASKLKLDFTWAEDFYSQKKSPVIQHVAVLNTTSDVKEKQEISDLKKELKYTVDAAFEGLFTEEDNLGSDEEEDAILDIVYAIKSKPAEESRNIVDRILARIPFKQDQYKESKEFSENAVRTAFSIIIRAMYDKALSKEIASSISTQFIEKSSEFLKYYEFGHVECKEILNTFLCFNESLSSEDIRKIVELCANMPERIFFFSDSHIISIVKLFDNNIHKFDPNTLSTMMNLILKNPNILVESCELLAKIVYLESDNDLEAREHWIRRRMIFDALMNKLKLYARINASGLSALCDAFRSIIPALSLHERMILTREIMLLEIHKVANAGPALINALHDVHESEKIVREVTGFNRDLARAVVKAGR